MIKSSGFCIRGKGGRMSLILLHGNGLNLYCTFFTTTTPFLEFSIQFQSNNLIYDKRYNKRQQVIYSLILLLREEGLGYRKISRKLNQRGIKTHRGKKWFNTSVSSVLKRKHERDLMNEHVRNQHFPSKISKLRCIIGILIK